MMRAIQNHDVLYQRLRGKGPAKASMLKYFREYARIAIDDLISLDRNSKSASSDQEKLEEGQFSVTTLGITIHFQCWFGLDEEGRPVCHVHPYLVDPIRSAGTVVSLQGFSFDEKGKTNLQVEGDDDSLYLFQDSASNIAYSILEEALRSGVRQLANGVA